MSFANFTREISGGIHQMEGHLEMVRIEIAFENFSPMRNFNLGRLPMRIRLQKKNLCIFLPPFISIPHVMCFLTQPPFECTFKPSPPFKCVFEPSTILLSAPSSSHFLSSAPSSPHLFRVRL